MSTAYGHTLRHDPKVLAAALDGASHTPYWLDDPNRPAARPTLAHTAETDLVVIGGGFCGLWTAILAKERSPERRVVLLEGSRIAWAASGRNGGFAEATLTHGYDNGMLHFASELPAIDRLAAENFQAFGSSIERYEIDAEWEESGVVSVATEPHQVSRLRAAADRTSAPFFEGGELKGLANSPLYRAGIFKNDGYAFVNPARLAWGLASAAERLGVEIYENSPATRLRAVAGGITVSTPTGAVRATHAALAANAFPSLVRRLRLFTVPIYDYALMTEPLTKDQLHSIGWTGRHGITDSSREFHYARKTSDNRILFGGFDAIYHRGGRVRASHDQRPATFMRLADHFMSTFPQLRNTRFTHQWGGAIDMSTQLVAFHGVTKGGRVAYSAGYTGLGVVATRFGADVMLDFIEGRDTERTRLRMSRKLPVPIPPEPVAYPLIQMMRRAVAKSDANQGIDGPLLRLAAAFGVGFDS